MSASLPPLHVLSPDYDAALMRFVEEGIARLEQLLANWAEFERVVNERLQGRS